MLARERQPDVEAYLGLASEIRTAQVSAARDDAAKEKMRTLDRERHDRLAALVARTGDDQDDVQRTLTTALADEDVATAIRTGTLEKIPDAATGFGAFGDGLAFDTATPQARFEREQPTAAERRKADQRAKLDAELDVVLGQGALEIGLSVNLMGQICSALAAAHSATIIHRDLKPDNIMVEEQPDGQILAKVLDFGIAKMREAQPDEEGANLTGANIIGSPAYMSPEQSLGTTLDARSDIYSLGVVLYEMLTGSTPFGKGTPGALLTHQINTPPPPMTAARPEIPAAIESVVMKALAKDREARFASATQFAQALRKAFDDPDGFAAEYEFASTFAASGFTTERIATFPDAAPTGSLTGTIRRRLAILPLRNLAGDPEIDFLGFALADSVITQLAPLKSLIVRPSSAVEKYRNQVVEPRAIGRELQVDTILSGSYLKAADISASTCNWWTCRETRSSGRSGSTLNSTTSSRCRTKFARS